MAQSSLYRPAAMKNVFGKFKRVIQVLIILGLVAQIRCAESVNPEDDCGFVQNSEGQRVSWRSRPVNMFVSSDVPQDAYPAIQKAMDKWNQTLGYKILVLAGVSNSKEPANDGKNVIYWPSTWTDPKSNEQGNTTIFWKGEQISEADIKINAQSYVFSYDTSPSTSQVDLESLFLHELGHVLGLKHEDAQVSVMNRVLAKGSSRTSPYEVDRVHIKCEY